MKSERELFEEYLFSTDKFKFRNKVFLFMLDENGEYEDIPVLEHWNTWQAYANREGYKLVPLEPNEAMLEALQVGFEPDYEGGSYDSYEGYKAMIKVIDNDH